MNKQFVRNLQFSLILMYLFVLNAGIFVAHLFFITTVPDNSITSYYNFWISLNLGWLLLSGAFGVYSASKILSFEMFSRYSMRAFLLWVAMILLFYFLIKGVELSRLFIIATALIYLAGLLFNRFIYLGLGRFFKNRKGLKNRVLILGHNETAKKLARYLEKEGVNTELLGYSEDYINIKELTNYPVISEIKDTIEISKKFQINEVLSTITPEQNNDLYDLILAAEKEVVRIRFIPDFSFFIKKPVHIDYLRDIPILSLRSEPLEDIGNRIKKKALDIIISFFVTIFILSWLIPIISILIYLESRGPVFFVQMRSGKNNKPFPCLKFRSMSVNKDSDMIQARKGDLRITKLGSFLRRTSLDEFPQFINVLKGEMSVVGPRPHMIKHTHDYSKEVTTYMSRHFLKPGITGWAQINGLRGEIKNSDQIKKRVEFDLHYLENWSLWLDIKIIFLTLYNIIQGDKQAY